MRHNQHRARRPRGQSLVEFAISFPVVMLMILFGIDFGRVFLGWLSLSNAVREGANFAAINPDAWTSPGNAEAQAEFVRLITAESGANACALPATLPSPTFPSGSTIGSPAVVAITCRFSIITPLVSNIIGGTINVSASSSFPIRSGLLGGSGYSGGLGTIPPVTVAPVVPTATPMVTASPIPTPSPVITAPPMCSVPDLVNVNTSQATKKWTDKGFTANNLTFNPLVPPNYKIRIQSQNANTSILCSSTMSVAP